MENFILQLTRSTIIIIEQKYMSLQFSMLIQFHLQVYQNICETY